MKPWHFLSVLCFCAMAAATPPLEPLDVALNYAELVVVGRLGPLTPIEASRSSATGEIVVTEVLKGPADVKSVTLTTLDPERVKRQGGIDGGVIWPEGKEGIWIVKKSHGQPTYFADNPAHVQPKERGPEIRRILRSLGNDNTATTQPVERQGISLSVTFKPKAVGRGDTMFYSVSIQNVSDKDIPIYRTNRDTLRFVETATGREWVTQASLFPPPPAPPALSTFKAREVWSHTRPLPPKTKFVEAGGKIGDAREGLPAGRYRLEYSTAFMNHYPDKKQAVYTGTIKANAIEFEITDKPAPATGPVTLKGTAIPQVDHNAIVDRARYNMVLEVVDEQDKFTRYAVKINDISRQHIARDRGAKPVVMTGTVEEDGKLRVITPTQIELQPLPMKEGDRRGKNAPPIAQDKAKAIALDAVKATPREPLPLRADVKAPVLPVGDRAVKAEKVFVGTLVKKVAEAGWSKAELKVDEPIKNVNRGDLVKVRWLPKVAGYDAPEGQKGLALLLPKQDDWYWLRADTFDDIRLADQARQAAGAAGPTSQPASEIPLGSIYATSGQKELQRGDGPYAGPGRRGQAPAIASLAWARDFKGLTKDSLIAPAGTDDKPLRLTKSADADAVLWAVIYFGSTGSSPPQFLIDSVTFPKDGEIEVAYHTAPPGGIVSADLRAYVAWIPLGKLTPETYILRLVLAGKTQAEQKWTIAGKPVATRPAVAVPQDRAEAIALDAVKEKLKAVDVDKRTITATAQWTTGPQDYTEPVTDRTQITLDGQPAALADLGAGMKVRMVIHAKGERYAASVSAMAVAAQRDARKGIIVGVIVDERGKALAGAKVTLHSPPRTDAPQTVVAVTTSKSEGEFSIEGVAPAEGYIISAETDKPYRWGSKDKIAVKAGATTNTGQTEIKSGPRM